jgi:hypothetical protein
MILTDPQPEKTGPEIQVTFGEAEGFRQLRVDAYSNEVQVGLGASGREENAAGVFTRIACRTIPSSGASGRLRNRI